MEDKELMTPYADKEFLESFENNEVMGELGANDFILPRYKLVQNTSRAGTPGKWVSNLNPNNELDVLRIVILKITNFRTYFPPTGQGEKPLCRSNDGKVKASVDLIGDSTCGSCRYAAWRNNDNGKPEPPVCYNGYNLFGIILLPDGTSEIGSVSFKRSAVKACKQYFTRMRSRGVAPFAYPTFIKSVAEVNDKGRFFRPEFDMGDLLTKEEILSSSVLAKQYSDMFSTIELADENENLDNSVSTFIQNLDAKVNPDTVDDTLLPF